MKAYGITSPIEEQLMQESSFHGIPIYCNVRLAENILLNSMGPPIRDASYSQIDVSHPLSYRENLRDVFDYVQTDSGLLIPEDDVPDLLERILNLQEPARQERIKERVKGQQKGKNKTFNSAGLLVVKHTKNIDIHMIITRRLKSDYTSHQISYMF